jgi:ABC-2 type transport system permease protein
VRWLHIGLRDLKITVRDRASLGILIAMPMILIVILSSALGNLAEGIEKTPVGIVNLDKGGLGQKIVDAFDGKELQKLFLVRYMNDPSQAADLVARGDLAGALVIPRDFTRFIATGRRGAIDLYVDPGRPIAGVVFRSVAEAISTRFSAAFVSARTVDYYVGRLGRPDLAAVTRGRAQMSVTSTDGLSVVGVDERAAEGGEDLSQLAYYAGAMSVMFIMFGAMFGAFSLIRERDNWTLPRMLMTPTARTEILGGKLFGVFLIGMAQFGVLYAFTTALGVKWGDPVGIVLVAGSTVCAATGLSIFIAAVGKTVRAVSGLAQMIIQFMAAIGGSFIPVSAFPSWMQPLHYASVNGWSIDAILRVMRGGTAVSVVPNVIALLVIAAVFFSVGAWRLRWE